MWDFQYVSTLFNSYLQWIFPLVSHFHLLILLVMLLICNLSHVVKNYFVALCNTKKCQKNTYKIEYLPRFYFYFHKAYGH